MFKFIHTADWHLGAPNLPEAYGNALAMLIAFARENETKTILCVGDVFDKPKPTQRVKDYLLKQLCINKDIRFIFVPGNHDYETKELEYHSLEYLKTLEDTYSLDNVFIIEPGTERLFDNEFRVVAIKKYEELETFTEVSLTTIVAWHGTPKDMDFIKGAETYTFKNLPENKDIYVAFGDIHKHRWPYSGALVQKTFSCESGFYSVAYDNKFEYTPGSLKLPKRVTVTISDNIKEKDIIKFIKKETNKEDFVKIKFNLTAENYAALDKDKLRQELSNVVMTNDQKDSSNRRYSALLQNTKSLDDELLAFINKVDNLDRNKLLTICKKYLK